MKLAPLLLALLVGCVPLSPFAIDPAPRVDSEVWAKDISWGRAAWVQEARKRFDNPFVFVVHGASEWGVWTAYPDEPRRRRPVETLAWDLHLRYPNRPIVLVCCNKAGATISVPNVWYAKAIVRARPNDPFKPQGQVDSIWQFVNE